MLLKYKVKNKIISKSMNGKTSKKLDNFCLSKKIKNPIKKIENDDKIIEITRLLFFILYLLLEILLSNSISKYFNIDHYKQENVCNDKKH